MKKADLKRRPEGTKARELGSDIGKNGIDRWKDGAAVSTADDELGHGGEDQHGGVGANLVQSVIQGRQMNAVDELGRLHWLPGGDVESGHIATEIGVTDHRKKLGNRQFEDARLKVEKKVRLVLSRSRATC